MALRGIVNRFIGGSRGAAGGVGGVGGRRTTPGGVEDGPSPVQAAGVGTQDEAIGRGVRKLFRRVR